MDDSLMKALYLATEQQGVTAGENKVQTLFIPQ